MIEREAAVMGHGESQRVESLRALREDSSVPAHAPWVWARQWEFWLALVLGAFLRLWRLDLTQYLEDQTRLMTLARLSVTQGLIPLTSLPSSIHTLNPPLSVYLMLPFVAFTSDPMPVVVSIALWNVLAVGLCYIFALRYFGRRIAAVSALLLATCGAVINYSRFIWPPNYLAGLVALWALTLYLLSIDGRRRWFAAHVALLGLMALLHPTAALLAPATVVGVALAPRLPSARGWALAALALIALALPTVIWEALSGFSDLHAARSYALGHSRIDPAVLYYLYQAIGGPTGTGSERAFFFALNALATLLFAIGWLVLTARLLRPARALPWERAAGRVSAARGWLLALWRGLRADASWRATLLLWLAVTVPPALMLRHTGGLFAHYLMVLYPTAFIVSGIGAVTAIGWLATQVERRSARLAPVIGLALEAALLALLLARSAQWLSYPLSLTNTQTFNAYHDYGYPLSVMQGGAATFDQLQTQVGASTGEIITSADARYRLPEDYIFAGQRSDRVTLTPNCLALPPADGRGWLVAPVIPNTPAATLLGRLANAQQVGTLPMLGGPAYPVYVARGETPLQPGEARLTPSTFDDQRGDSLRLLGASLPQAGAVLLRWQIVATSVPVGQNRQFRVVASSGAASAYTDCTARRWQPGETLFTWLSLPTAGAGAISVHVETASNGLAMPSAGPLRFVSDAPAGQPLARATPSVGASDPLHVPVAANADGSLTIPAGTLSPAP